MIEYNGMVGRVVFVIGDSEDSECFESGDPQEVKACAKIYKTKKANIEDWEGDDWFEVYFIEDDEDASPETVSFPHLPKSVKQEIKQIKGK